MERVRKQTVQRKKTQSRHDTKEWVVNEEPSSMNTRVKRVHEV